jgi:hypothetical protein
MNRLVTRIAGPLTGLLLAAIVAGPTLAATPPASQPGAAAASTQADRASGEARCRAERASARANPTLENAKAVASCEIDRRLATLASLKAVLDGARGLTDAHKASLIAILDATTAGLTALRGTIAGESTIAAVRADAGHIAPDYRVYVLVARQVHLARGDDGISAAADRLTDAAGRLETAIATTAGKGRDVTSARRHLAAAKAAIDAARAAVAGDASTVLGLTPAGWNAGTAKPVLDAARASIVASVGDLRTAAWELRAGRAALR